MANWLIRAGGAAEDALQLKVVYELGIFVWLYLAAMGRKRREQVGKVSAQEHEEGWLSRTKGTGLDEGGVAAGF